MNQNQNLSFVGISSLLASVPSAITSAGQETTSTRRMTPAHYVKAASVTIVAVMHVSSEIVMKAQIQIHINDTPVTADVTFGYISGKPAYTPRGEYAPIDPPEPPEVDIHEIWIPRKDGKFSDKCPEWLVDIIANDESIIEQLIEIAEEIIAQEQESYVATR